MMRGTWQGPSVGAMDVVARFAAQLGDSRSLWRAGRRHSLAAISALRCDGELPLIGADTVQCVTIDQPISQVRTRSDGKSENYQGQELSGC